MTNSEEIIPKGASPTDWRRTLPLFGLAASATIVAIGIYVLDWREIGAAFRDTDPNSVLVATVLFFCCFAGFSLRWGLLIWSDRRIGWPTLFAYQMIGYTANALMPLRPGDVIRIALLRQRHRIGAVPGLASIALERLIDSVTVLLMGSALVTFIDVPPSIREGLQLFAVAAILGIVLAAALVLAGEGRLGFLSRLPPPLHALSQRVAQLRFSLLILTDSRRALGVAFLTILGWVCFLGAALVVLEGMHIGAPWYAAPMVVVVTSLGSAIPSSPGSIGIYHLLVVLALSIWRVDSSIAVAYAILLHSLAICLHIGLGIACALAIGASGAWRGRI
jgi:glycosyltransferase 2 family protein